MTKANPKGDKPILAKANSIEMAGDASITWRHFAPAGATVEDCESPNYWQNVVREIGQERVAGRHSWNKIEIIAVDGTWEATLRVVSVESPRIYTRRLSYWTDADAKLPTMPKGYSVEYVDQNGWRGFDQFGNQITEKKATKADAIRICTEHAKPKAA